MVLHSAQIILFSMPIHFSCPEIFVCLCINTLQVLSSCTMRRERLCISLLTRSFAPYSPDISTSQQHSREDVEQAATLPFGDAIRAAAVILPQQQQQQQEQGGHDSVAVFRSTTPPATPYYSLPSTPYYSLPATPSVTPSHRPHTATEPPAGAQRGVPDVSKDFVPIFKQVGLLFCVFVLVA